MTSQRATLTDVAREAGLSTAVVSYVLNNGPRPVSASSRERVLTAIKKLDYTPDRAARALRRRKSGMYGLIVPDATLPFFGALANALDREISDDGMLLIGNTGFLPERELQLAERFIAAGVDALYIVTEGLGDELGTLTTRTGTRCVWLHADPGIAGADVVRSDHRKAGREATLHLIDEHHRSHVVFAGGQSVRGTINERFLGYTDAMTSRGLSPTHFDTDLTPDDSYRQTREHLDRGSTVDGLIVSTYGQTTAAVRAVFDAGRSIPGDISLVSFDGDPRARYERPTVTTMLQDVSAIAAAAVQHATADETSSATLDAQLTIAESCGCVARTPA